MGLLYLSSVVKAFPEFFLAGISFSRDAPSLAGHPVGARGPGRVWTP